MQRGGIKGSSGKRMPGIQDLLQRLRQQKQRQLDKYNLGSMMDDIKEKLEDVVKTERGGIQKRVDDAQQKAEDKNAPVSPEMQQRMLKRMQDLAKQIMSDQENALETLAREELNVDPGELGGSAWEAAIASFVLFAIGAIAPVIPFAFLSGMTAVIVSAALSMVGLFVIGSAITLYTGRGVLFSGSRQVIFGLFAAAVTYGIGRLIGVSIGG